MTKLYKAIEVAAMLRCSVGHIRNLTSQRRITAIKGIAGTLYDERDIERYIAFHKVEARNNTRRVA